MKKVVINEKQRGLFFKSGKFVKVVNPGKYYLWNDKSIEILRIDSKIYSNMCSIDILLKDNDFRKNTKVIEVLDEHICLHFVNEKFKEVLLPGRYAFWEINYKHKFKIINISKPEISENIPKYIFEKIPKELYRKIEVLDYQKVVLYYNKKIEKILGTGIYYFWNNDINIEYSVLDTRYVSESLYDTGLGSNNIFSIENLFKNEEFLKLIEKVKVEDEQIALHYINGVFEQALTSGEHAFWSINDKHTFEFIDISKPEVSENIPKYIFEKMPKELYRKIEVLEYQKALLYFNKNFVRLLSSGVYYFWKNSINIDYRIFDTRITQLNISGQEILTQDKVTLRINFVCNYKIIDYIKIFTKVNDYQEQIHIIVQLALREYIGKYKIDEVLENKEQLSNLIFEKIKEKSKEIYIDIFEANIKDIIIPGEIRDIMNTVLIAEKKAQANVISRREEVASTRSLLNTAKLMDENKTLLKLKELEYIERICENIGNININGSGDIISQLSQIMKG